MLASQRSPRLPSASSALKSSAPVANSRAGTVSRMADAMVEIARTRNGAVVAADLLERGFSPAEITANAEDARALAAKRRAARGAA